MANSIIIHTDEITLKGGNRQQFERLLIRNIKDRLDPIGSFKIIHRKGTVILRPNQPLTEPTTAAVVSALQTVFGIAYFKLAEECPADLEAIKALAINMIANESGTFRVTARRADKKFPHDSLAVSREVGGAVLAQNTALKVDLHHPDQTINIEINVDGTFVSLYRFAGPGGLPTDSIGRVVVLLSGGIDSPVAAYKIMSRGCRAALVHFHSYPHVGRESIEKVRRLAQQLNRFQLRSRLYIVPFADIQREITAKTNGKLRVILYRRAMLRIAERIAVNEKSLGLVTGDSVGQVASQTLENLLTVGAAVSMPVHRPLVGDGKMTIVDQARKIGTFDISAEPHDDCCSLFVPDHPELRATPERAAAEEQKLELAKLIDEAIAKAEIETLNP
ncbi:MAG: tRNA uracil 4-sulfurtransferase ThiI [Patescibacteria group bacterium]